MVGGNKKVKRMDQRVKILKEERQRGVGGEGFSQGFGGEAKGETHTCGEMKEK